MTSDDSRRHKYGTTAAPLALTHPGDRAGRLFRGECFRALVETLLAGRDFFAAHDACRISPSGAELFGDDPLLEQVVWVEQQLHCG